MTFCAIAACDMQGGIGYKGNLPWDIPQEKNFFWQQTRHGIMIMGHKTYLGLPQSILFDRIIIVFTKQNKKSSSSNLYYVSSDVECLQLVEQLGNPQVFVIGGGEIFDLFFSKQMIHKLYLSWIPGIYKSDTFFPLQYLKNSLQEELFYKGEGFTVVRYIFTKSFR